MTTCSSTWYLPHGVDVPRLQSRGVAGIRKKEDECKELQNYLVGQSISATCCERRRGWRCRTSTLREQMISFPLNVRCCLCVMFVCCVV
jgi:hypothetical protein